MTRLIAPKAESETTKLPVPLADVAQLSDWRTMSLNFKIRTALIR